MPNAAFLKLALLAAASLAGGCTVHRYYGSSPPPSDYGSYGYSKPAYQPRYDDYDYTPTQSSGKPVHKGTTKPKPAAEPDDQPKAEPKPHRTGKKKPPKRRPKSDEGPRRTTPKSDEGPRRTTPKKPLDPSTIRGDRDTTPDDEVRPEMRPERKPTVQPQVKPQRELDPVEIKPERKPTIQTDATKPRRTTTAITTAPRRTH